jgi:type IV fimbrial biogenesis protein FimT
VWDGNPTLVFVDTNRNRRRDGNEELIAYSTLTESGLIRWRASGARNYLRYRPDGGIKEWGTFEYCPRNREARYARQIIISSTGRPRSAVDSNGDGIVEDRNGDPARC